MTSVNPARALLLLVVTAIALNTPALESLARQKKPPVVEAPPPPPPPPPAKAVGLPDRLVADAAAYEAYLQRVTATSPNFSSGASIAEALKTAAAYEPKVFIRGAIAYGAVAALEDQAFVTSVRDAGTSPENRRLMVSYILSDPTYPFNFQGSDTAAGLAKQAIGAAGLQLYATGKIIKQSAYDIQHQSWSKEDVLDRGGRLAAVEASAANGMAPAVDRIPLLKSAMSGVVPIPITAPAAKPPYTPLVARAMQLAAIAALGEAGDDAYDQLTALTVDDSTDACLHMAKLNLYQCLAVAKPHYEDVFCMGQHVMLDTGACLTRSVGVDLPVDPIPPPPAAPPRKPTPHRRGAG